MKLLLGTTNKGKIVEMSQALAALHLEIVSPEDIGITEIPQEDGLTFAENAEQKARFYYQQSGISTLADDSGIIVEALQNELGIHTRRWGAGADASDHHWISFFLERMSAEQNKKARFVCDLCFIDSAGNSHHFEGKCDGLITNELEADYLPGLPISACFKPDGYEQVYSAMSAERKNEISHRGRSLQKFLEFIAKR